MDSLQELVGSGHLSAKAACRIVNQFDYSVVKTVRSVQQDAPFVIEGNRLAAYRFVQGDVDMFLLKDVEVFRCFEPKTVQIHLQNKRILDSAMEELGDEVEPKPEKPWKPLPFKLKQKYRGNHFRVRVAWVPELLMLTHNPTKGYWEGAVTFGEGETKQKFWATQVRENLNPYFEYMYYELRVDENGNTEKKPEEEPEVDPMANIPLRVRRTKDFQTLNPNAAAAALASRNQPSSTSSLSNGGLVDSSPPSPPRWYPGVQTRSRVRLCQGRFRNRTTL